MGYLVVRNSVMRLVEINPGTDVAVYDRLTGAYTSLGSGFEDSDAAMEAAEAEVDGEYTLVAELAHLDASFEG